MAGGGGGGGWQTQVLTFLWSFALGKLGRNLGGFLSWHAGL